MKKTRRKFSELFKKRLDPSAPRVSPHSSKNQSDSDEDAPATAVDRPLLNPEDFKGKVESVEELSPKTDPEPELLARMVGYP